MERKLDAIETHHESSTELQGTVEGEGESEDTSERNLETRN